MYSHCVGGVWLSAHEQPDPVGQTKHAQTWTASLVLWFVNHQVLWGTKIITVTVEVVSACLTYEPLAPVDHTKHAQTWTVSLVLFLWHSVCVPDASSQMNHQVLLGKEIIINAFLMCGLSLWLYMCEAQGAIHETLQQYTIQFNNALHISLYPSSPASTHWHTYTPTPTYTQSRNPSLPPLSSSLSPPPIPQTNNNNQSVSKWRCK